MGAEYQLGRAFLQAAFIGVNWEYDSGTASWWLAQAPGPGLSTPNIQIIQPGQSTILGVTTDWASTWKDTWAQANASVPSSTNSSSPDNPSTDNPVAKPSSGLSTGAKVGIAIAAAVVGLALIVGAIFLWRRKRTPAPDAQPANLHPEELPATNPEFKGYYNPKVTQELDVHSPAVEVPVHYVERYELQGV